MIYKKLCEQVPLVVILIGMLVVVTGCTPEPVKQAIDMLDRAERDLADEPAKWRSIIDQVAKDLPKEVQSTLRNELDDLVQRSIAETGVEFRCTSDFYADRAKQGLERLKAILRKKPVPAIEPKLCKLINSTLNLNLSLDDRNTIEVYGYDMDQRDHNGQLLRVSLVSETGNSYPLQESYIGRTTHYQFVIYVGKDDVVRLLSQNKINKIRFLWGNMDFPYEVLVIQKQLQTKTISNIPLGSLSHTPKQTGQDADFHVNSDKPLKFKVRAESQWVGNAIQVRVYMYGRETDGGTEVDSWSEWKNAYVAEYGSVIVSYAPTAASEKSGKIPSQGKWVEELPAGELVDRFEIYGDRDGDEAGSYTRVEAFFNEIQVTTMKVDPTAGMDWNTSRTVGNILQLSSFDLELPDPNLCLSACQQNSACQSWTYTGGPVARCVLTKVARAPVKSTCCISGIK